MASQPTSGEGLPPAHERLLIISRFAGQAFLQAGVAFFVLGTLGVIFVVFNEGDIFGGQATTDRPFWRYIYTVLTVWPPVVLASAVLAGVGIGCRLYGEAQMARLERHDELLLAMEGDDGSEEAAGASANDDA